MTDLNKEREAFEELPQFKYQLEVCEWNEEQGLYINESGDPDFEYFADACNDGLTAFLTQLEVIARLKKELEKAKAQAVPEGYVLMPKVPTEKMFQAYERSSVAPMSTLSKTGYKAMVEASESGAEG